MRICAEDFSITFATWFAFDLYISSSVIVPFACMSLNLNIPSIMVQDICEKEFETLNSLVSVKNASG